MSKEKSLKEKGFYHSKAWRAVRKQVLIRDKNLCRHCLESGKITLATTIHHVMELDRRPDLALDINNLISLCRICHEETRVKPEREAYRARVIRI